MSTSIDTIVTSILSDPKPVILFDTCALLDIVRSAERDNINSNVISSAITLTSSYDKWLISSEVVNTEWQNNINDVETTTRNTLRNLHKRVLIFKEALGHSPSPDKWNYSPYITSYELEKNLKSISDNLRKSLTLIENDKDCTHRASERVIKCIAPSSKGKSEFKDCLIIEHYIALGNKLKNQNFSYPIIFVSSNKTDFGSPFEIKEPLDKEFANANIQYVGDLTSALKCCT